MDEKVILAALEEIKVHALKFTMSDVTRRLRMSKSSLYKLVDSKDKLITAIVTYLIHEFKRKEQVLLQGNESPRQKIMGLVQLYTQMFQGMDNGVYGDLRCSYEAEWQRWSDFRAETVNHVMQLLQEGIDQQEFRPVNIAVVKQCLLVSSEALADSDFLQRNNLTCCMAIEQLSNLLFVGLENK